MKARPSEWSITNLSGVSVLGTRAVDDFRVGMTVKRGSAEGKTCGYSQDKSLRAT